ncbi:MAG: hypothetical protein J6C33_03505 [Lachnospiraceae bacterium]|nr:hypothetical protein [Lachnospiraceae bacterium]
MQKFIKKSASLCFFAVTTYIILRYPRPSLSYALLGLNTWFQNMIPTLFPFMVLSGMMLRLGVSDQFAGLFRPLLYPFFRLKRSCLYCIVIGFLCGFPMGARITADLYRMGRITGEEASFLLAFCNNIGPVFFMGYVLPFLPAQIPVFFYLLGMYGVPMLYGWFLRRFRYAHSICDTETPQTAFRFQTALCRKAESPCAQKPPAFADALDESVSSGLQSITKLGGYMIFFNLLNVLPQLAFTFLPSGASVLRVPVCLLMEITSGIRIAGEAHPLMILVFLQFGGISCIAQTLGMIAGTDLSIGTYTLHKLMQSAFAFAYYGALFHIFF